MQNKRPVKLENSYSQKNSPPPKGFFNLGSRVALFFKREFFAKNLDMAGQKIFSDSFKPAKEVA